MTREIHLTRGFVAIIDDEDYPLIASRKWRTLAGRGDPYAVRWLPRRPDGGRKLEYMHRVIARPKCGEQIDHINGNSLDNRRANLRVATMSQNQANRKKPCNGVTSKYKGVSRVASRRRPWQAQIRVLGRGYNLGTYATERLAAAAYDAAAVRFFGEFARTNAATKGRG